MPDDSLNPRKSRRAQVAVNPKLRWAGHLLALSGFVLSGSEDNWMIPVGRIIHKVTIIPPEFTMVAVYAIPLSCFIGAAGFYLASFRQK